MQRLHALPRDLITWFSAPYMDFYLIFQRISDIR